VEKQAMICTWCEKSAAELFPVPGRDGSAQMVCRSCAGLARGVAKWTFFLATTRMPAEGHCECDSVVSVDRDGFLCEKCGRIHRRTEVGRAPDLPPN
jgi:hypothetical protein